MSYSFSFPGFIFSPEGICTGYSLSYGSSLIFLPYLTIILLSTQVSVKNINFSRLNVPVIYLSHCTHVSFVMFITFISICPMSVLLQGQSLLVCGLLIYSQRPAYSRWSITSLRCMGRSLVMFSNFPFRRCCLGSSLTLIAWYLLLSPPL